MPVPLAARIGGVMSHTLTLAISNTLALKHVKTHPLTPINYVPFPASMKIRCLLYRLDDLWVLEPLRPAIGLPKHFRCLKEAHAWAKARNITVIKN